MAAEPARTLYCSRCLTTFPGDADRCPNLGCRSGRPAAGWGELLVPGQVIDRTYRVHTLLAIGGAGVTYLGAELDPDGEGEVGPRVAIKVLYAQRDQGPYLRRLATEAQILQGLNHPNIVECRGFVHRTGHSPYLVTRFMEGGSLLDHVRRVGTLPVPAAAGIARQICWALDVAHRQGVIHRDLKPENVLLDQPVARDQVPDVRVADFGIAKVYGGVGDRLTRVGAFVGTPQYAAPEQFDGLSPEPSTDVYAVGALLYFCVAGRHVADFMAELEPDSQKEHLLRHLPPRLDADLAPAPLRKWMEDTLAIAMAVDAGDRCDINQLEQRLAAMQEGRDPGFVRLPPVAASGALPPPRAAELPSLSADTLDAPSGGWPVAGAWDTAPPVTEKVPRPPPPPPVDSAPPPPPVTEKVPRPPPPPPPPRSTVSASFPSQDTLRLPPAEPVPQRASRLGCWMVALASAGLGALAFAGAAWFAFNPTPIELTASEKDPARARDWSLVAGTLGERGVEAERACNTPPYLAIEVVVEADGALREARLLNYAWEPTRACIEKQLGAKAFPRAGDGPVRVAVTLPR